MDTADTYGLTSRPDTLHMMLVAPCAPTIAALRRVVPDDEAGDCEATARAYLAGVVDGHEGTPYLHDPRALAYGSSVWHVERLAYRAGFRHGDPEGRPVAVVHALRRRAQAAAEVLRIGSAPRLLAEWPQAERNPRDQLRALLRDARRKAARGVPRPCAAYFAAVLGHWAETAGPTRAQCPDVCGADDAHLGAVDRARDAAADAAEAWAWYQTRETDYLEREQRHDYPCDGPSSGGALITPNEYVTRLEHGDAVAPDGRRAPCPLAD